MLKIKTIFFRFFSQLNIHSVADFCSEVKLKKNCVYMCIKRWLFLSLYQVYSMVMSADLSKFTHRIYPHSAHSFVRREQIFQTMWWSVLIGRPPYVNVSIAYEGETSPFNGLWCMLCLNWPCESVFYFSVGINF